MNYYIYLFIIKSIMKTSMDLALILSLFIFNCSCIRLGKHIDQIYFKEEDDEPIWNVMANIEILTDGKEIKWFDWVSQGDIWDFNIDEHGMVMLKDEDTATNNDEYAN